jgi:hypothetical protein
MTKQQKIAVGVAIVTLAIIVFISVFRNGTSW